MVRMQKKLVKEATKLNKERRYEEAIDKLDHALKLDASNAKGFAQRGLAHDQLEKTEAAAKDYAMASFIGWQNRQITFTKLVGSTTT